MNAPNHSAALAKLREQKHFDFTTKIGSGRYTADAAKYLYDNVDKRWGLLKKPNHLGGANHWNHHAVDAILYRSDTPGQSQSVDIVGAGESSNATPGWIYDTPRYNAEDWLQSPGDTFVLPAHDCKLGCSMFWLVGAYHRYMRGEAAMLEKIDKNCDYFKSKFDGDYLRVILALVGKGNPDPWGTIGGDSRWPDFEETVGRAFDHVWTKHGLMIAPTLVGEGSNVPTQSDRDRLVDTCVRIFNPRLAYIPFSEMWNERWVTDGTTEMVRRMVQRMHDALPALPLAPDSPAAAAEAPGEGADPLAAEVTELHRGSPARVGTPQWNRSEPNPRDMGPDSPRILVSHEPRGPGASAGGDIADPLALIHDYIQSLMASKIFNAGRFDYKYHTYHCMPGAWGGECNGYPSQNKYADLWDVPNAADIASAFKSVRNGQMPDIGGGDTDMPLKPRDTFYAEFKEINTFYGEQTGLKRPGGMVIDSADPVRADHEAMGSWGYDLMSGKTVAQIKNEIVRSGEWAAKHPGETPPTY